MTFCSHYHHAGLSMLDGMLHHLGYRIAQIKESLICIDPIQQVFRQIHICCRVYQVPGPNSLWYHDGQHGILCALAWICYVSDYLARFDMMGHCDSWINSRLIMGLWASDNNSAATVFNLFMCAAQIYGVPSWMRGDHGVENMLIALFLWSIHKVRTMVHTSGEGMDKFNPLKAYWHLP